MKELSKQVKALWGKKSNVDGQELGYVRIIGVNSK